MGSPEGNMGFALLYMSLIAVGCYLLVLAVGGRILGWLGVKALKAGRGTVYFSSVGALLAAGVIATWVLHNLSDASFVAAITMPVLLVAALPIANWYIEQHRNKR